MPGSHATYFKEQNFLSFPFAPAGLSQPRHVFVSEVAAFWFSTGATRLIANKSCITAISFCCYDDQELSAKYCSILQVQVRIVCFPSVSSLSLENIQYFRCQKNSQFSPI